jgi:hypothetical protein
MNCFSICFRNKTKPDDPSDNYNNITRKRVESRRLSKSYINIFRGTTMISQGEREFKSFATNLCNTGLTEKPLKRIGTIYQSKNMSSSPGDEYSESSRKRKAHWVPKDKLHCYFCGGEKCKHENWKNHEYPAIRGLHSDYITEEVIASQRPSSVLVRDYNLINVFKELGIGLIVNVQREGEHPYCGPNKGLEDTSGFAYDPHDFITEDIRVRQTGWKDMSVPDSMYFMLEIVKDMAVTIYEKGNRVLVHCHAGYGRTGVVIACFLIYVTNRSVDEIVEFIRDKRPGCVQKTSQFNYVRKFKMYIDSCRPIFCEKNNIEYFMKNQNDLLFGDDSKKCEFVPRLISVVLEKIIDLYDQDEVTRQDIYTGMFYPESWTEENENLLISLKTQLNLGKWEVLNSKDDIEIKVLAQLLYDWLEDSVFYVINPEKIFFIFEEKGLSFLINQHIKSYKDFTASNRKSLSDNIKYCLRSIESETLCCIGHFINKIRPEFDNEEEFIQVTRRLCASLLGFSTKNIRKNNEEIEKMLNYSIRLFNLITFFGIIIENDVEDEVIVTKRNQFSTYVNRRKVTEGVPRMSLSRKTTEHIKSDNVNNSSSSNIEPINSSLIYNNNNKIKININNSYNGGVNDHVMYEVYKVLENCVHKDTPTSYEDFLNMKDGDNEIINKLKDIFNSNEESNIPGHIVGDKRASLFSFGGNVDPLVKRGTVEPLNEIIEEEKDFRNLSELKEVRFKHEDVIRSKKKTHTVMPKSTCKMTFEKKDSLGDSRLGSGTPIKMRKVTRDTRKNFNTIKEKNHMFKEIEDKLEYLRRKNVNKEGIVNTNRSRGSRRDL